MKPQWDIHIPLEHDELLSSWLARAALAQGCDPLVLTEKIWDKWRVWTTDVDRIFESVTLMPLSTASGVELVKFKQASLFPLALTITGATPQKNNTWPWILALGVRNTKHRSGLQFCPACLVENKNPYYKKQWRLAWHTTCDQHQCLLLDRCHACKSPIEPHRLFAEDKQINLCATCKVDLSTAKVQNVSVSSASFQKMVNEVLVTGYGKYHNQKLSIPDWFQLAEFFLSMLRRELRNQSKLLTNLLNSLNTAVPKNLMLDPYALELLRTTERHSLFSSLHQLMSSNNDQFEHMVFDTKMTQQSFCSTSEVLPAVLEPLYVKLKRNSKQQTRSSTRRTKYQPRPPYTVKRMARRLERKLELLRA